MRHYRDIIVWQKARALVVLVYRQTDAFPERERFGITSQLRRAVISVVANIAEGSKRRSQIDFARFLNIAEGSCAEVQALLVVAADLGFTNELLEQETDEILRMLYALRSKVESDAKEDA